MSFRIIFILLLLQSQDDNTLATACPTPEWEKNTSCKSLDHMSVACLQVKIHEVC